MPGFASLGPDLLWTWQAEFKRKVTSLGGIYTDHFTNNVTHLVASRVGSCKYQLAMRMELPVVTQDWVEDLYWQSDVPSDEKFRLQALYGCCITVTGLPQTDRNIVEATARMFGAEFSPDLRRNRTTHLIAAVASGAKYDAAIRWGNITVVPPKWFYDSVVNQSTPPSTFFVRCSQSLERHICTRGTCDGTACSCAYRVHARAILCRQRTRHGAFCVGH